MAFAMSGDNATVTPVQQEWEKLLTRKLITHFVVFSLTLVTFIYGVTSWWIIRKFRNFTNFVYLNTILANILLYTFLTINIYNNKNVFEKSDNLWLQIISFHLIIYLSAAKNHWLVIICHMFYVDIVKVFNGHISRRYLKSSLFGWVLAIITSELCIFAYKYLAPFDIDMTLIMLIGCLILPLIVNCLFYFVIVFSIFRSFNASTRTAKDNWRCLYLATLIFILSDILLLSNYVIKLIWPFHTNTAVMLQTVFYYLNTIILDVFFVVVRSNRELWYKLYVNKLNERSLAVRHKNHDIKLHGGIIRDPVDSRPAALDV